MARKSVYIVGPIDTNLIDMFNNSPLYKCEPNVQKADILCFQGGADINPKLYGEEPLPRTWMSSARDDEDLDYWEKYNDKPKVGICRGGQFLNVMSGGELWQDVNGHGRAHQITNILNIPNTPYEVGEIIDVTSDHHQMMVPHPTYGDVIAFADEATIFKGNSKPPRITPVIDTEVVWYEHTKSLCFQPHPEYQYRYATRAYFLALMRYLIG